MSSSGPSAPSERVSRPPLGRAPTDTSGSAASPLLSILGLVGSIPLTALSREAASSYRLALTEPACVPNSNRRRSLANLRDPQRPTATSDHARAAPGDAAKYEPGVAMGSPWTPRPPRQPALQPITTSRAIVGVCLRRWRVAMQHACASRGPLGARTPTAGGIPLRGSNALRRQRHPLLPGVASKPRQLAQQGCCSKLPTCRRRSPQCSQEAGTFSGSGGIAPVLG